MAEPTGGIPMSKSHPKSSTRIDDATVLTVLDGLLTVEIEVITEIDAPDDTVWRILTDTDRYPSWNPFVTRLAGRLAPGSRIAVTFELPGRQARTLHPTVTTFEPNRRFAWIGRVGVPGVLDARHTFTIEPVGCDRSRLVQHERLAGALVPLVRSRLERETPAAFVALNRSLAAEAFAAGRVT
jgi:hypothetical protein